MPKRRSGPDGGPPCNGGTLCNAKRLPPIKLLQERFRLDGTVPSGLVWNGDHGSRAKDGNPAGSLVSSGYYAVKVDRKSYMTHRIVWALANGKDPWPLEVDHKDGQRTNNDESNLRAVTRVVNASNKRSARQGSSRYLGVSKHASGRWVAQIRRSGRQTYLGLYDEEEAAAAAYDAAAREVQAKGRTVNFPLPDSDERCAWE